MKIRKSNSSVRNALISVIGFRDSPDTVREFAAGQIAETFKALQAITHGPKSATMLDTLQHDLGNLDHAAIDEFVHLWAAGE